MRHELAIDTKGLAKNYGGFAALSGIDLEVRPGEVLGYIGPNGSGKSTTVKILTGLLPAFDGEARVAGFDVRMAPIEVKRRIGYVPEQAQLYDALTPLELLTFVGRMHDLDERHARARGSALLEAFGLQDRTHLRIGSLSKGMKQKVLFCTALLHDPAVLFLDEPLSGLDVNAVILAKELIRQLADAGKAVFYCSHVMDVVERVCDRIVLIAHGAVVAQGTFAELAQRADETRLEAVFSQLTGGGGEAEQARRIVSALRETAP